MDKTVNKKPSKRAVKKEYYTRPDWTKPRVLNKMKHGDILAASNDLKIIRVAGGFLYKYRESICFVSIDELGTD